jgi:hypothetical protein
MAGAGESGDAFGCSGEEEASSAAYVEDVFVATPCVQAEHEVAVAEFAYFDVKQEEKALGDEEARGPIEAASVQIDGAEVKDMRGKDSYQKTSSADEKEVAHDGGCIYAVVGFVCECGRQGLLRTKFFGCLTSKPE